MWKALPVSQNKMNKKNSLIELYRFLFALNVVKSHSFLPTTIPYFSPGRISVEFFFILSGYLFVRTLDRLRDEPLKKSLPKLIVNKLKPLGIPLVIGLGCNFVYFLVTWEYSSGIWGYLWYVHAMIITFIGYVIIRSYVKRDSAFFYTTLGICIAATLMRFSGIFYTWGYVRGAAAISLGMLLAQLPKIPVKRQGLVWLALIPVQLACFAIVFHGWGNAEWWGGFRGVEAILDLILYPALIYLTLNVNIHAKIFNYLGALSFGLYAFQCPADLMRVLGVSNRYLLFGVILGAAVLENAGKRLWRYQKACAQHPV